MIRVIMVAVKAFVVLPNPVHVVLLEERLHIAVTTIVVWLEHLAVEARVEMREQLLRFTRSARTIFLVMVSRELMAPGACGVEYTR